MSAASNSLENGLLKLIFQNIALTLIGDAAGLLPSAAAGNLHLSLHTADPGEAGTQATSEAAYTGYARVAVVRSAVGWTVTDNEVENAADAIFPSRTDAGAAEVITHIGIGTDATGTGKLLYRSAFTSPTSLSVTQGIAPKFDAAVIKVTVD